MDAQELKGTLTFGFDENFTGLGARHVKFLDGERLVGFPIHSSTHVRWQCITTNTLAMKWRKRHRERVEDWGMARQQRPRRSKLGVVGGDVPTNHCRCHFWISETICCDESRQPTGTEWVDDYNKVQTTT